MINKYIGIPYKDKGRDFKGCDCYGLVKLYYENELNINIPDTNIQANQPRRIMINFLNEISSNWIKVEKPIKHCVVALASNEYHPKLITHFGLMLDDNMILHCINKINSHITSIKDIKIKAFIKGYYKWQH